MPFSTLINSTSRLQKRCESTPQSIGDHLVRAQVERRLSKKAVAQQIGVNPSTYAKWERGEYRPEATQMKNIIAFLGYYPLPEPTTLAGQIRKYRHVHGLTLEEFGKLLSVDGATVWTWENERYTPGERMMGEIKRLIG